MGTSETTHSQNFNYLYDFCSVCQHVSLCRFTLTPSSLICAFRLSFRLVFRQQVVSKNDLEWIYHTYIYHFSLTASSFLTKFVREFDLINIDKAPSGPIGTKQAFLRTKRKSGKQQTIYLLCFSSVFFLFLPKTGCDKQEVSTHLLGKQISSHIPTF